MFFVNKKQEKVRKNHKSLISRNQRLKRDVRRSVRRLKDRTASMMSLASTNWRNSRMNLAESMNNLSTRSKNSSKADTLPAFSRNENSTKTRHLSMQDRLEAYNQELDDAAPVPKPRVRKTSKVVFDGPTVTAQGLDQLNTVGPQVERLVVAPTVRTRKVSKISMFEFVPEEKSNDPIKSENNLKNENV